MSSIFDKLCSERLITDYPSHMKANVHYECMMGSNAYGVSDDNSDIDIYGFCIPPRHLIFPYSYGYINGFGSAPPKFKQFQEHHIFDKSTGKEYDIVIYNIVRYFQLCMENNPNMVDSLFVPARCVLHISRIGNLVRDNRKLFLSKKSYHTFKGYAFGQRSKMQNKFIKQFVELCKKYNIPYDLPLVDTCKLLMNNGGSNEEGERMVMLIGKIETNGKRSKRIKLVDKYGYDTKFAYHIFRLMEECKMILEEEDLDLTRSRELLKSVRRGEFTLDQVNDYFDASMISLEEVYNKSTLRYSVNEDSIKDLLLKCLEEHYGNLSEYNDEKRVFKELESAITSISNAMKML